MSPKCRSRWATPLWRGAAVATVERAGRVRSLADCGAFVDLGGADGLIHISELAWGSVGHPSDVLSVGDEVDVLVLSVDRTEKRISLSRKRIQPEPWATVPERYVVG